MLNSKRKEKQTKTWGGQKKGFATSNSMFVSSIPWAAYTMKKREPKSSVHSKREKKEEGKKKNKAANRGKLNTNHSRVLVPIA